MHKICAILVATGLFIWPFFMPPGQNACAFDIKDATSIGAAYTTHLFLHEVGHQVVAEEVGADSPQMNFLARRNGKLYPGLSTCQNIPKESILPYAAGGERMAGFTFEYALQSYRHKPTTYNKALMFIGCTEFLIYTVLANYVHPEDDTYDPNLIRAETGLSKELLLSLVMAKSLMNTYRVFNENANFTPIIRVDKDSAAFVIRFKF